MTLRQILRKLLTSLGVEVNDNGTLESKEITVNRKKKSSVTLKLTDGRVLLFPTNKVLKNIDASKEMVFNPILENVKGSDTESYKLLSTLVGNNLKSRCLELSVWLIHAINKLDNTNFGGILEFINKASLISNEFNITKISKKSVDEIIKFIQSTKDGDVRLFNMISKRMYTKDNVTYKRGVVITSPLYDHLKSIYKDEVKEYTVNGVKINAYILNMVLLLIETIIPDIGKSGRMVAVSDDNYYPSFIALMELYGDVMKNMRNIYNDIKTCIPGGTLLDYEVECLNKDELSNLKEIKSELEVIPSELQDNESIDTTQEDSERIVPVKTNSSVLPAKRPNEVINDRFKSVVKNAPAVEERADSKIEPQINRQVNRNVVENKTEDDPLLSALRGGRRPVSAYANNYVPDVEPRNYAPIQNNDRGYVAGYPHRQQNRNIFLSNNRGAFQQRGFLF